MKRICRKSSENEYIHFGDLTDEVGVGQLQKYFDEKQNPDLIVNVQFITYKGMGLGGIDIKLNKVFTDANYSSNRLESIKNIPACVLGHLLIYDNKITSLVGIRNEIDYCGNIDLSFNPITDGGLGLLLIDNLENVHYKVGNASKYRHVFPEDLKFDLALSIIRKYLPLKVKGLLACQQELIDAGLERFAVL